MVTKKQKNGIFLSFFNIILAYNIDLSKINIFISKLN